MIQNNLFTDVASGNPLWGNNGGPSRVFELLTGLNGGSKDVTIDHNTITSAQDLLIADPTQVGLVFTNNIAPVGEYGVTSSGEEGTAALNAAAPGYVFQGNVIAGANASIYPPNNSYPSSLQAVGFANLTGGNYQLAANSPELGQGTSGSNPGANMVTLEAAQSDASAQPVTPPVTPPATSASKLALAGLPSSVTAGSAVTFTVTATDANGNSMSNYRGTIRFTSSDSKAILPANYTFTAADNGVHTFTVTFKTSGSQSLTATDSATSSIAGSLTGITVNAASTTPVPASRLVFAGIPSSVAPGQSVSFTVTAANASGQTATGYRGTVHFTSSDSKAILPANYTFTAADNGVHTFTVTFKTAGSQSLTATDTTTSSITGGQAGITVATAPATATPVSRLVFTGIPSSVTPGQSVSFTVTAANASGQTMTGYRGTVHFSSSDSKAILPANYTFTAADNGVHTFTVTFKTFGSQSLTATDTTTSSVTGSQTGITVSSTPLGPVAALRLVFTGIPSSVTVGTAVTFTITAVRASGQTYTSYIGTVRFRSSDSQAILPANYTFTAADNGTHTFTVTFKTPGSQSLGVTSTLTGTINGNQAVTVTSASASATPAVDTDSSLPDVTYHGGPLLQNVQIQSVFYGQSWSTSTDLQQFISQVDGFLNYFTTSPYISVLKQYAIGNGSFMNDVVIPQDPPSGQTIDDSQIRQILNSEITSGQLAMPTSNQLYVFFTAPGVSVTLNGQTSDGNFGGYHDNFIDSAGNPVYYAVLPYPTGQITTQPLTSLQQATVVLSHEVTEAMTDPNVGTGWFDSQSGEEVCDLAEGHLGVLGGYEIQGVWSQAQQQVVVPTDATGVTPASVARLVITDLPTSEIAGTASTFTVTAIDASGNPVTGYTGTVQFSSSDGQAVLPASYTFTAADNGTHTFTITFNTAGRESLSVADTATSGLTGTREIRVAPADPSTTTIWSVGPLVLALDDQAFTDTVARFNSSDSTATAGSFTTTIDWGDGTTSAGTINANGTDGFEVEGTHTYNTAASSTAGFPLGDTGLEFFLVAVTINEPSTNASAVSWSVAIVVPTPPIDTAERQTMPTTDGSLSVDSMTIGGIELNPITATHTSADTQTPNTANPTPPSSISVIGPPSVVTPPIISSKVAAPPVQNGGPTTSLVSVSSAVLGNGSSDQYGWRGQSDPGSHGSLSTGKPGDYHTRAFGAAQQCAHRAIPNENRYNTRRGATGEPVAGTAAEGIRNGFLAG